MLNSRTIHIANRFRRPQREIRLTFSCRGRPFDRHDEAKILSHLAAPKLALSLSDCHCRRLTTSPPHFARVNPWPRILRFRSAFARKSRNIWQALGSLGATTRISSSSPAAAKEAVSPLSLVANRCRLCAPCSAPRTRTSTAMSIATAIPIRLFIAAPQRRIPEFTSGSDKLRHVKSSHSSLPRHSSRHHHRKDPDFYALRY